MQYGNGKLCTVYATSCCFWCGARLAATLMCCVQDERGARILKGTENLVIIVNTVNMRTAVSGRVPAVQEKPRETVAKSARTSAFRTLEQGTQDPIHVCYHEVHGSTLRYRMSVSTVAAPWEQHALINCPSARRLRQSTLPRSQTSTPCTQAQTGAGREPTPSHMRSGAVHWGT